MHLRQPIDTHALDKMLLRKFWKWIFQAAWVVCLFLFLALGALRAYGLYSSQETAFFVILLVFLTMWWLPFVFYSEAGQRSIGVRPPRDTRWYVWGFFLGTGCALIAFNMGYVLYGMESGNWLITLRERVLADPQIAQTSQWVQLITIVLAMVIFVPVGEELFFRGMVHEAFGVKWGSTTALLANSLAFGVVHLLHHGLFYMPGTGWNFFFISGPIYMLLMIGLGMVLTLCRQRSGSIWASVVAHASFNFVLYGLMFLIG